jgi:hypothetical protein
VDAHQGWLGAWKRSLGGDTRRWYRYRGRRRPWPPEPATAFYARRRVAHPLRIGRDAETQPKPHGASGPGAVAQPDWKCADAQPEPHRARRPGAVAQPDWKCADAQSNSQDLWIKIF